MLSQFEQPYACARVCVYFIFFRMWIGKPILIRLRRHKNVTKCLKKRGPIKCQMNRDQEPTTTVLYEYLINFQQNILIKRHTHNLKCVAIRV